MHTHPQHTHTLSIVTLMNKILQVKLQFAENDLEDTRTLHSQIISHIDVHVQVNVKIKSIKYTSLICINNLCCAMKG